MIKEVLFNPFKKIAGTKALLSGTIIMAVTAIVAYYSYCHFDGVIDAHVGGKAPLWVFFAEALIAWGIAVIIFYAAGKFLSYSSGIRFIDLAGTIALARYPFLIVAIVSFMIPKIDITSPTISLSLVAGSLLMILGVIWFIALLYNAVVVSCNFRNNGNRVLIFIAALIVAEILSKVIFYFSLKII